MELYIKGVFKKTIFKSNNNYVIGLFRLKETNDDSVLDFLNKTITITGYFHELTMDEQYIMYGNLVDNPRYGLQYNVVNYERVSPDDKDGSSVLVLYAESGSHFSCISENSVAIRFSEMIESFPFLLTAHIRMYSSGSFPISINILVTS